MPTSTANGHNRHFACYSCFFEIPRLIKSLQHSDLITHIITLSCSPHMCTTQSHTNICPVAGSSSERLPSIVSVFLEEAVDTTPHIDPTSSLNGARIGTTGDTTSASASASAASHKANTCRNTNHSTAVHTVWHLILQVCDRSGTGTWNTTENSAWD